MSELSLLTYPSLSVARGTPQVPQHDGVQGNRRTVPRYVKRRELKHEHRGVSKLAGIRREYPTSSSRRGRRSRRAGLIDSIRRVAPGRAAVDNRP